MTALDTTPVPAGLPEGQGSLSPGQLAMRRFRRHRLAVAGLIALVVLALGAIVLPFVLGTEPNAVDPTAIRRPPGDGHPLGTDSAGRDVLARQRAAWWIRDPG